VVRPGLLAAEERVIDQVQLALVDLETVVFLFGRSYQQVQQCIGLMNAIQTQFFSTIHLTPGNPSLSVDQETTSI
jgi:hypothetical protein